MIRTLNRLLFLVAVANLPVAALGAESRDSQNFFSLNTGDLRAEAADARASGRKALLVMFEQEGCRGCRHMRTAVLNRPDVQDYFRAHFINLSLDIRGSVPLRDFSGRDLTETAFSKASKIKGTPTFVFYDLNGNEIVRVFGRVEKPAEFLQLGHFVASGAYRTRSFAEHKLEKSNSKGP